MNELVYLENDKAVCSSLTVAEKLERDHCEKLLKEVYSAIEKLRAIDDEMAKKLFDYMEDNLGNKEILLECAYKFYFASKDMEHYVEVLLEAYQYECAVYGTADFIGYATLKALVTGKTEVKNNMKRVYLIELANGTVKIGVSSNIERRIKEIESQSGFKVTKIAYTKETDKAFNIESNLHKTLADKRLKGEFFAEGFEDCKRRLEAFKDIAYLEIKG